MDFFKKKKQKVREDACGMLIGIPAFLSLVFSVLNNL